MLSEGMSSAAAAASRWVDVHGSLDQRYLASLANQFDCGVHLAVMREPYLSYIVSGRKTIESRLSRHRIDPHGVIRPGDLVFLKRTAGPICGIAEVDTAMSTRVASFDALQEFLSVHASGLAYDPGFLESKRDARYVTLIFLKHVREIDRVPFHKSDRRAWVCEFPNGTRRQRQLSTTRPGDQSTARPRIRHALSSDASDVPSLPSIFLSGHMASGKSTIAARLSATLGLPLVSFGNNVRAEARRRGLDQDRATLQDLGAEMIATLGADGFVALVAPDELQGCIADGVRHISILASLRHRFPNSVAVHLTSSDTTTRFATRERVSDNALDFPTARLHHVESDVEALHFEADLVIRTTDVEPELVESTILAYLASRL